MIYKVSQKELLFILREIDYAEVYEMYNRMSLAGASKTKQYLEESLAKLDSIYYSESIQLPSKDEAEELIRNGRQKLKY